MVEPTPLKNKIRQNGLESSSIFGVKIPKNSLELPPKTKLRHLHVINVCTSENLVKFPSESADILAIIGCVSQWKIMGLFFLEET